MTTRPKPSDSFTNLKFIETDGTLRFLKPFLATARHHWSRACQGIDLRRRQANLLASGKRCVVLQTAHLTPSRQDIVCFKLAQITLRSLESSLKKPRNRSKRGVNNDPDVAQRQPEHREPQVHVCGHTLRSVSHDIHQPFSAQQGPTHKERKCKSPCEGSHQPRQPILLPEIQQELTRVGGVVHAKQVGHAKDDHATIAGQEPHVDGPVASAE